MRVVRRNSSTTGAVVVANPRKRRRAASRRRVKNTIAVRTNRRRKGVKRKARGTRRNTIAMRTNRRRRTARRSNALTLVNRRRRASRRRNPIAIRTNSRRRRSNPLTLVNRRRRSSKRRNPLTLVNRRRRAASRVIYKYRKNRSHRRARSRRNPSLVSSLRGIAQKFPFIGGTLATMVGFAVPAAFGALGVIPVAAAAKYLARYAPGFDTRLFYILSGLALATVVKSKFVPLSSTMKQNLAMGIAAATGAIALHKHLTGMKSSLAGEYGLLEYGDGGGDDMGAIYQTLYGDNGYAVIPGYGDHGIGSTYQTLYGGGLGSTYQTLYGDPTEGEARAVSAMYADAGLVDSYESGDDFSIGEIEMALAGPAWWRQQYPAQRMMARHTNGSQHSGQEGGRWGWLIKLIGFQKFQQIAKLPRSQRQAFLEGLKRDAQKLVQQYAAQQGAAQGQIQGGQPQGVHGYGSIMAASRGA